MAAAPPNLSKYERWINEVHGPLKNLLIRAIQNGGGETRTGPIDSLDTLILRGFVWDKVEEDDGFWSAIYRLAAHKTISPAGNQQAIRLWHIHLQLKHGSTSSTAP